MPAPPIADEDTARGDRASLLESELPWIFAGRYEIRALLGAGGMGSVYAAFDRELDDLVAVKMMRSELLVEPGIVERFRREVRLARRITHPNVVRVYDLGVADGTRYFTMERIVGRSLGDLIDQEGALEEAALVRLAREIAAGLGAAHRAGVIHRDLKPDNVVVEDGGRAVLTDFGIARPLTEAAGEVTLSGIGTPAYMAPELFETVAAADAPCDVFSLGCMLFEAATGRLPFAGETHGELVGARLRGVAPDARAFRPDLSSGLAELISRCLARDRAARFDSAIAAAAFAAALPEVDEEAAPPSLRARPTTVRRRDETPAALSSPSRSSAKSVAVLPFSASADDAHLAGGLHESLISVLAGIPALRVRPRGRVAAYRGTHAPRAQIARELDARVLVEGTLERRSDRIRVAVRTFGSLEGFPLWSARFDCDVSGVGALAETVARGIADALAVARPERSDPGADDPRVAELVMRARQAYHGFWHPHAARALELFEEALSIAPRHPSALSGACLAALRVSLFTTDGLAGARRAAERAAEVAPDASEVRVAEAALALQDGDVPAALVLAKRAVLASPELAEAQALLGRVLLEADLLPEGMRHLEWAIALEPDLWLARWDLTRAHALAGDWERVDAIEDGIDPQRVGRWLDRARYALWRRDVDGAKRYLAEIPGDAGPGPILLARAVLEVVAAEVTDRGALAFDRFHRQGAASARQRAFVCQIEAEIACFQGRRTDALSSIVSAADAGLTDLAWLMRCPLLEPLRASPPFGVVVRHVGVIAARVREALYEE